MSKVPRYVEIQDELRRLVAARTPGDRLPSDTELCAQFGVSRMTARQAVAALEVDGLVRRMRGSGTFVEERAVHRRLSALTGFSEEMRDRSLRPSSRILDQGARRATKDEACDLDLSPGAGVVFVSRLRLADDLPVAIEHVVLPASLAAVLEFDLENGSLHDALDQLGRHPTQATGSLTARLVTAEEAELLLVSPLAALLVERRLITDTDGEPIERTETRYAGDRYIFDVNLRRDPPPATPGVSSSRRP